MRLVVTALAITAVACVAPARPEPVAPVAPVAAQPAGEPQIRSVSAPKIREVSAANVQPPSWLQLPAPHRGAADSLRLHVAIDLRALVGHRDKRDPLVVALGWAHDLGARVVAPTGAALVADAQRAGTLASPTEPAAPGDLLVFDHTEGDAASDLVALAIARDPRGVTEMLYVGGGVVRRGFVDPLRPALRRDAAGDVVNTFMRTGKRWPPKGTHYLAGELLAHVIHVR